MLTTRSKRLKVVPGSTREDPASWLGRYKSLGLTCITVNFLSPPLSLSALSSIFFMAASSKVSVPKGCLGAVWQGRFSNHTTNSFARSGPSGPRKTSVSWNMSLLELLAEAMYSKTSGNHVWYSMSTDTHAMLYCHCPSSVFRVYPHTSSDRLLNFKFSPMFDLLAESACCSLAPLTM